MIQWLARLGIILFSHSRLINTIPVPNLQCIKVPHHAGNSNTTIQCQKIAQITHNYKPSDLLLSFILFSIIMSTLGDYFQRRLLRINVQNQWIYNTILYIAVYLCDETQKWGHCATHFFHQHSSTAAGAGRLRDVLDWVDPKFLYTCIVCYIWNETRQMIILW